MSIFSFTVFFNLFINIVSMCSSCETILAYANSSLVEKIFTICHVWCVFSRMPLLVYLMLCHYFPSFRLTAKLFFCRGLTDSKAVLIKNPLQWIWIGWINTFFPFTISCPVPIHIHSGCPIVHWNILGRLYKK